MKYLISQELAQAERRQSGCLLPRSNPRLGRESSSRERMGQQAGKQSSTAWPPSAGSTGLSGGGELQVGSSKYSLLPPLPLNSPRELLGSSDGIRGEVEGRHSCSTSPSPRFPGLGCQGE